MRAFKEIRSGGFVPTLITKECTYSSTLSIKRPFWKLRDIRKSTRIWLFAMSYSAQFHRTCKREFRTRHHQPYPSSPSEKVREGAVMDSINYNASGTVFDIQRFSLHDGLGIRTSYFERLSFPINGAAILNHRT